MHCLFVYVVKLKRNSNTKIKSWLSMLFRAELERQNWSAFGLQWPNPSWAALFCIWLWRRPTLAVTEWGQTSVEFSPTLSWEKKQSLSVLFALLWNCFFLSKTLALKNISKLMTLCNSFVPYVTNIGVSVDLLWYGMPWVLHVCRTVNSGLTCIGLNYLLETNAWIHQHILTIHEF